ncbi:hypothetical protein K2X89_13420, partial [Myxococcota bacterium]|nr:hypothetical protein [Myxococcota bacterium]
MESTFSPPEWIRLLDDAELVEASGATILERGRTYATSGAVEVVAVEAEPVPRIRATVHGTQAYSVEIGIEDD